MSSSGMQRFFCFFLIRGWCLCVFYPEKTETHVLLFMIYTKGLQNARICIMAHVLRIGRFIIKY